MARLIISFGGDEERRKKLAEERAERDRRNPYYRELFCTCGRLCDLPVHVVMLGNGQCVNICKDCRALLEAHQRAMWNLPGEEEV